MTYPDLLAGAEESRGDEADLDAPEQGLEGQAQVVYDR
jgi:hypothetical protein